MDWLELNSVVQDEREAGRGSFEIFLTMRQLPGDGVRV
jgi:hypothetical protein